MAITAAQVKKLRDRTNLGMMDCKVALTEAGGDMDKAIELLRKRGLRNAEQRSGRTTGNGRIGSYIHHSGSVGVIIEANCETDFVSKNQEFTQLINDLAMQIAATKPKYVSPDSIPTEIVEKEKAIYTDQVKGKPENIVEKILEGKLKDFYKQTCLIEQPFVKDGSMTVGERIKATIAKLGENIVVRRFARLEVGEEG